MRERTTTKSLKRWLLAALAVGLLAFSGDGTFASFNATTVNKTSSLASGTLTLSDQVNSGTVCFSANASTHNNVNTTCSAILSITNIEPGEWNPLTQTAKLTIENTGSLNASLFNLQAPSSTTASPNCHGTYTQTAPAAVTLTGVKLTTGKTTVTDTTGFGNVTPGMLISGTDIPYSTASPTTVVGVYGKKLVMSQAATGTVTAGEAVKFYTSVTLTAVKVTNGSPTLKVTSGGFPKVTVGMVVSGTGIPTYTVVTKITGNTLTMSQNATATAATGEKVTFGATDGKEINFATNPATRPICSSAIFYIQETAKVGGVTRYYCWYGYGSTGSTTGTAQTSNKGLCTAPLSTITTTSLASCTATTTYTLHLNSLTGPVFTTDTIVVTSGSKKCTLKAQGGPYAPTATPTTISAKASAGGTAGAYTAGATVADSTTANHLNSTTTYTLKNFDKVHGTSGPMHLYPINGAGTVSHTASVKLGSLSSRYFTIGIYLPAPNTVQNALQGLKTMFSIEWYIQQ